MVSTSDDNRTMTRSAAVVGGATLASRILGLVRDMVLAGVLGASVPSDAFFAAFRLPNFLRRMFAEGSLTAAFIPVYTEVQTRDGAQAAFRLACAVLNWLLLTLLGVSIIGVLFAPELVQILTPGWTEHPDKFSLTIHLTRIMFPYILLISMTALAMGILNAQGHFAAPAAAPALLNISLIVAAIWASLTLSKPVYGIAVGVIVGGLAQVVLQVYPLWTRGFRYRWCLAVNNADLRRVGRLFIPSVWGSAVYQFNMIVITILASFLPHGSLSYLYYADRLFQFPLGIFAIAMGTAALPVLSRHAARSDMGALRDTLGFAFRQVSLIMLPCMVGLMVLREPLISLLFQRGRFDVTDTSMSAQALLFYSVGLWFVAQIRILGPVFYSLKDTVTPMKIASLSIVLNLLFSLLLMGPLGHAGLALAVSLSSMVQFGLLALKVGPKLGGLDWIQILRPIPKMIFASALMGLICLIIASATPWLGPAPLYKKILVLASGILAGVVSYGTLLSLLNVVEIRDLIAAFVDHLREKRS